LKVNGAAAGGEISTVLPFFPTSITCEEKYEEPSYWKNKNKIRKAMGRDNLFK